MITEKAWEEKGVVLAVGATPGTGLPPSVNVVCCATAMAVLVYKTSLAKSEN